MPVRGIFDGKLVRRLKREAVTRISFDDYLLQNSYSERPSWQAVLSLQGTELMRARSRYGSCSLSLAVRRAFVALMVLSAWTILGGGVLFAQAERSQRRAAGDTLEGEVVSLEKKGRSTVLTVKTVDEESQEEQQREIILTPRVAFVIVAKADDAFLAAGRYLQVTGVTTNDKFFGREFIVTIDENVRKAPAKVVKAPARAGQSTNSYIVTGEVVSRQQDEQFNEYEVLMLKGGRQGIPVYIDETHSVQVSSSDSELATAGSKVELEGRLLANGRFNATKVVVHLAEPLKAEDYPLPNPNDKRGGRNKR